MDFSSCPIFSIHFLHPQVDFLCHNPVTLAALFEFDILIYSLRGFMELEAFPCAAHHKEPLTWIVGTGEGSSEGEIKKE